MSNEHKSKKKKKANMLWTKERRGPNGVWRDHYEVNRDGTKRREGTRWSKE